MSYQIVATGAVLDFALAASASERRRLGEALRTLAASPAGVDDGEIRVASGRIYKTRLLRGFRIVYATDHLQREVEVINVEPSAPWRKP